MLGPQALAIPSTSLEPAAQNNGLPPAMAQPGLAYPKVAVPLSANSGSLFDLESNKQFMSPYPLSVFEAGGAPYMCVLFIRRGSRTTATNKYYWTDRTGTQPASVNTSITMGNGNGTLWPFHRLRHRCLGSWVDIRLVTNILLVTSQPQGRMRPCHCPGTTLHNPRDLSRLRSQRFHSHPCGPHGPCHPRGPCCRLRSLRRSLRSLRRSLRSLRRSLRSPRQEPPGRPNTSPTPMGNVTISGPTTIVARSRAESAIGLRPMP